MKKLSVIICMLLSISAVAGNKAWSDESSDVTTYDTKYYGPEQGCFAISFGAEPVINFVGNMFNGTDSQHLSKIGGVGAASFSGKYFFSDNTAFTLGFGVNNGSTKDFEYEGTNLEKESIYKTGNHSMMLNFGLEYRLRSGKRLQPIFGAKVLLARSNKFQKNTDNSGDNDYNNKFPTNSFGIICDAGVELFLTQSISLSAVVDLAVTKSISKEKISNNDNNYSRPIASSTDISTGNLGSNIALNFYF